VRAQQRTARRGAHNCRIRDSGAAAVFRRRLLLLRRTITIFVLAFARRRRSQRGEDARERVAPLRLVRRDEISKEGEEIVLVVGRLCVCVYVLLCICREYVIGRRVPMKTVPSSSVRVVVTGHACV
jgi:hypothetical protein